MNKSLGIAGSISALVGIPALLALTSSAPEAKDPTPGALTVSVSTDTTRIRVEAPGTAPEEETTSLLASEDGKDTAIVTSEPETSCAEVTKLYLSATEVATTSWCLSVTSLPSHGTVAGTMTGAGEGDRTKLALKVQRRAAFTPLFRTWPFWVLVCGLLVALLSTSMLALLWTGIAGTRLRLLVALNASRPVAERVDGVAAWVQQRRAKSATAAELVDPVSKAVQNGPKKAADARADLTQLLEEPESALPDVELVTAAQREARRTDHQMADFYTVDGTEAVHPALVMADAIKTLAEYYKYLDDLEKEAQSLPGNPHPRKLQVARFVLSRVRTLDDLKALKDALGEAREALDDARANSNMDKVGLQGLRSAETGLDVDSSLPPAAWLFAALGLAALTALAIAVTLAFAAVTVYVAGYDANPTFGSWQDGFKLFSSAVASGVAATVLGLLAPWRPGTAFATD
ncbi:hypothetical protein [Nocardioides lacusdianchii]|uniref:hypothetical protein n=1 Tax=Nocardioides lacusdianchii TaxID=2783664 RepID=UPI001CCC2B4A|nr:hypothetical protein [Nocardioides lacusdianchii]